jgi:hypothetical protein
VCADSGLSEVIKMARLNAILIGLAAIACTLCAMPLRAATHPVVVQFSPALPLAGQTVTARLNNGLSNACWPPATSITRDYADITIRLDFDDACPSQYLLPSRDYVLGAFPADNYNLIVISCSNNPPPFPSECNVILRAPFSVLAPRTVDPAPILSPWVMLALLAALIAATAVHLRRVRYRRRK